MDRILKNRAKHFHFIIDRASFSNLFHAATFLFNLFARFKSIIEYWKWIFRILLCVRCLVEKRNKQKIKLILNNWKSNGKLNKKSFCRQLYVSCEIQLICFKNLCSFGDYRVICELLIQQCWKLDSQLKEEILSFLIFRTQFYSKLSIYSGQRVAFRIRLTTKTLFEWLLFLYENSHDRVCISDWRI